MATAIKKRGQFSSKMGRPQTTYLSSFDPAIVEQLKKWRGDQSEWGPLTLHTELKNCPRFAGKKIPSRSAIARFLKLEGFVKPNKKRASPSDVDKHPEAERPHQRWQVDAKGNHMIPEIGAVSLINIKDVYTNIYTGIFPAVMPGIHNSPKADDYRLALRLAFCEFGLPEQVQCDHASVFYDNQHSSPFPTLLHMWLIALGIKVIFSRVKIPQDQGQVERQHKTMWSQIKRKSGFANWETFYEHCQQRRDFMNNEFPCRSLGNCPPFECFPDAVHSGKKYRPEREFEHLNLIRVDNFLATGSWLRQVGKNGYIKISKQLYRVKGAAIGDQLKITFDAFTRHFNFYNQDDLLLDHHPAKGISIERLIGDYPIHMPNGFQLQIPFDVKSECILRLYETGGTTS